MKRILLIILLSTVTRPVVAEVKEIKEVNHFGSERLLQQDHRGMNDTVVIFGSDITIGEAEERYAGNRNGGASQLPSGRYECVPFKQPRVVFICERITLTGEYEFCIQGEGDYYAGQLVLVCDELVVADDAETIVRFRGANSGGSLLIFARRLTVQPPDKDRLANLKYRVLFPDSLRIIPQRLRERMALEKSVRPEKIPVEDVEGMIKSWLNEPGDDAAIATISIIRRDFPPAPGIWEYEFGKAFHGRLISDTTIKPPTSKDASAWGRTFPNGSGLSSSRIYEGDDAFAEATGTIERSLLERWYSEAIAHKERVLLARQAGADKALITSAREDASKFLKKSYLAEFAGSSEAKANTVSLLAAIDASLPRTEPPPESISDLALRLFRPGWPRNLMILVAAVILLAFGVFSQLPDEEKRKVLKFFGLFRRS